MRLARFKTVRGRLLALLIGIALPIAGLTAITAITTYQTVTAAIRTSQMRTVEDYAVRTRVWYRGALRSLLAGGSALALTARDSSDCGKVGGQTLARVAGYRAIHVLPRGGDACAFSLDPEVSAADLAAAAAMLQAKPPVQSWAGTELAQVRYDHVTLGGKRYLAVYAQSDETGSPLREGLLLVDPELLDQVFDLGDGEPGLVVALVGRGGDIIVSRGTAQPDDASWLPARDLAPAAKEPSQVQSRAGVSRVYATRIVADPDFYIIASFDDALGQAARTQFLVLLLAPLLTLALLCVVYLRAIDKHCVRWLRGIEAAARTRSTLTTARAVIADDMPSDIRSVAEAFNTMVEEQEVRQRKLQTALDDNRFLVRELHHRVKNSLQVVQSYIGLTKRDYRGDARMALADAECRVHVLSAAYRFTLADGEMQPVRIDLFVDDVVTMISNLLRRRDQWVTSIVDTRASLSVDRIIPLGFLIVDVMSRALRSTPGVSIQISVSDIDDGTVEIAIEADREIAHSAPPKLFAGLVTQIEAIQAGAPEGARLGAWRVAHFT
ncbi:sensor histidine kinase [Bosea psychrotolerans]|uniref:Two-component sensor histidine kinase n=1 Tax=Bosea psychrotolerans TaxID=1871628 RepID=A0A2S4M6Z8_9HYPH|nr:sensor histidine kinase [Bosea psychrotolerans]POR50307.1 two-component sensor histidine kinase [Bosea psychrotolerans]